MSYTILNIRQDGIFDISPLAGSIRWSGNIREAARKLELSLAFGRDYYLPQYDVPLGSMIQVKGESGEIIRAVVFSKDKNTDGNYGVVAYDQLIYFLKCKETYIFRNMTADAIIRKICSDFAVIVGSIPATGVVIDKLISRDDTLYDICLKALTKTKNISGKKYQMRMKEGKLHVIEKGHQTLYWSIAEKQNLIEASYNENIEETKNRIIIVGDKDQVLARVEDAELIKKYGLLQEISQESNIKTGEAQTKAKNLLKEMGRIFQEASVECLGLDDVQAGDKIEVKEELTGLNQVFFVDTDEHTVENGQHMMNLKLNWTDEVASKEDEG